MKKSIIYSLENINDIVSEIKKVMINVRFFAIRGSLGAGKTTLVRLLLQSQGVTGIISSPTFNYVNLYKNDAGQKFYHFDLYRMQEMQEFIDAGFDEYLSDPSAYVFIEWPEVIMPLLRNRACFIDLEYVAEGRRSLRMS